MKERNGPDTKVKKSVAEAIDSKEPKISDEGKREKAEEKIFAMMRLAFRAALGEDGKDKTLLSVMNEFDGMGDEIIRMHLLQRLLKQYPKIKVLIYSKYPFLYQLSTHVSILPLENFKNTQSPTFDVVLDHRADFIRKEPPRTDLTLLKADGFYVKTGGDGERYHSVSEVRSQTQNFIDHGCVNTHEIFLQKNSVYTPIVRLADTLGLPGSLDQSLYLEENNEAQLRIEQRLASAGATEYVLVNPFGNPKAKNIKEGYLNTELLRKDILSLHDQYPCVMICAFSQEDHQKAVAVLKAIPLDVQKKLVVIDFFLENEVDPKFYIAKARHFVTCEGGLMHLANALQRPVTVVLAPGGGGNEWLPPELPEKNIVSMGNIKSSF